jgi:L-ascorbate metabolism protein UlaG (beta-lactamase superfamily)
MKIKWFGHSAFGLTSESGKIVLTDPYEPNGYNGAVGCKPITANADTVTISHNHPDHNYTKELTGNPKIITQKEACEIAGIRITGIPTFHDRKQGQERGDNIIFVYEIDGLRIAHCGDLGHLLSDKDIMALGSPPDRTVVLAGIDIILIPIGGNFTIDAAQAINIIEKIKPKIVIPMHYKTEVLDFPIAKVDEFLKGKKNVKRASASDVSVTKETLPPETEIWVLPYAK